LVPRRGLEPLRVVVLTVRYKWIKKQSYFCALHWRSIPDSVLRRFFGRHQAKSYRGVARFSVECSNANGRIKKGFAMTIQLYPGAWRIMMCDFNTGFKPPELVKRRPVITLSKRRRDGAPVCTVIPISSIAPQTIRDFHYLLPNEELPQYLRGKYPENWVKIDMMTTVAFFRLTMLWHGRDAHGNRCYQTGKIHLEHQVEISTRLMSRLDLVSLDAL
jgi:uncharacterized protein YifN (PemK superfamily)